MRMRSAALGFRTLLLGAAIECVLYVKGPAQTNVANPVVIAPGRVARVAEVMMIGTAATGTVAELLVHDGARVEAGQTLVRIECAHLQKELDARTSQSAAVEASSARVRQGARSQEIAIARAGVKLAEARAQEAAATLRRLALPEATTTSEAQLDQSKRDAEMTAALLEEARARLALLEAGSRREDIAEAEALREAAKALVEEAAVRLRYCSVRAPANGVVLSTHVTPGQFVSAAVPVTLVKLVDDSRRGLRVEIDERDLAKICLNQHAAVTSESFPGVQIDGVVQRISDEMTRRSLSSTDRTERNEVREVLLALAEAGPKWPIGLRVSVRFAACPSNKPQQ
jgi:HlyD family secretion protein